MSLIGRGYARIRHRPYVKTSMGLIPSGESGYRGICTISRPVGIDMTYSSILDAPTEKEAGDKFRAELRMSFPRIVLW